MRMRTTRPRSFTGPSAQPGLGSATGGQVPRRPSCDPASRPRTVHAASARTTAVALHTRPASHGLARRSGLHAASPAVRQVPRGLRATSRTAPASMRDPAALHGLRAMSSRGSFSLNRAPAAPERPSDFRGWAGPPGAGWPTRRASTTRPHGADEAKRRRQRPGIHPHVQAARP